MSVNPSKQRKVLVVHGVRIDTDADIQNHTVVKEGMLDRLGGLPLDFECELFSYEDMNDAAAEKYKEWSRLLDAALTRRIPLLGLLNPTESLTDIVGDVIINVEETETAKAIKGALRKRLMDYYEAGHFVTVIAHSLGSIYSFDVINDLIREDGLFDRNDRTTWPVQGLITIGSPIGLDMFRDKREKTAPLGVGDNYLRWLNIWDAGDPVVTGQVFGKPVHYPHVAEHYRNNSPESGWFIKDSSIDSGRAWLMAHSSYWNNPVVIDELIRLVTT